MSWDLFIQDLPPDASSVAEIPDDFQPKPIGLRSELIASILEAVPEADFSDPAWGVFDAADHSIEFNMGGEEEAQSIALHVRGGQAAVATVKRVLKQLGRRALDSGSETGAFFTADEG